MRSTAIRWNFREYRLPFTLHLFPCAKCAHPDRLISRVQSISGLLERPVRGGMSGDVEVSDPARSHFHDHENVQHPKAGCHGDEEIAGQNALGMVADKRHPTLGRGAALGASICTSKRAESLADATGLECLA